VLAKPSTTVDVYLLVDLKEGVCGGEDKCRCRCSIDKSSGRFVCERRIATKPVHRKRVLPQVAIS